MMFEELWQPFDFLTTSSFSRLFGHRSLRNVNCGLGIETVTGHPYYKDTDKTYMTFSLPVLSWLTLWLNSQYSEQKHDENNNYNN
jgi:hypothetical protein